MASRNRDRWSELTMERQGLLASAQQKYPQWMISHLEWSCGRQ
jgi:hypothetical protein